MATKNPLLKMGNEPTAASGGRKEAREWQRSKFHERTANKKFWAPQQGILRDF